MQAVAVQYTEIRLHGCDPDQAEARPRKRGDTVLAGTVDKPHGLREVYLVDPDGYLWMPNIPVRLSHSCTLEMTQEGILSANLQTQGNSRTQA
jgi:hypothetical protein